MAELFIQKVLNIRRLLLWFYYQITIRSDKILRRNRALRRKEYETFAKSYDKESKKVNSLMNKMLQSYKRYTEQYGKYSLYPIESGMGTKELTFLYNVVKKLKPEVCIETGVANGFSTGVILLALAENRKGRLYSIDICYNPVGVVIPENLKKRWTLIKGFIKPKLKQLAKSLKHVDLFLHDGAHTYKDMLFDYQIVWTKMPKNSVLLSDDVNYNDAFLDFSDMYNQQKEIFMIGRSTMETSENNKRFIGLIRKV